MTTLRALLAAGLVVTSFGIAVAKLPAPPPMDDKAKAAAEEKKAKDAAAAEAAKAQQAKAEDRVAARYIAEQKAKGKVVTPQMGPAVTPVASACCHRCACRQGCAATATSRAPHRRRNSGSIACDGEAIETGASAPVFLAAARSHCRCGHGRRLGARRALRGNRYNSRFAESWPSGRRRLTRNQVYGNVSGVRIPHSPPE